MLDSFRDYKTFAISHVVNYNEKKPLVRLLPPLDRSTVPTLNL